MSNNNTMSIFAEALMSNRDYKNARINGVAVGVANARLWANAVKSMRIPAYTVRKYRYDNMGNTEDVAPCDMSALFAAVRPVLDLIGEVNGDKLNPVNIAEEVIALSVRFRVIDITPEMAHARCEYRSAKSTLDKYEGNDADAIARMTHAVEVCKSAVEDLEAQPGNCKRITEIQSESAFVKAIEIVLGDAITKQTLRPVDEILAEKAAKEAERKAKRKANKLSKKNAK